MGDSHEGGNAYARMSLREESCTRTSRLDKLSEKAASLDTFAGFLLKPFALPLGESPRFAQHFLRPFLIGVAVLVLILFLLPSQAVFPRSYLALPLLKDHNYLFLLLVSIPFLWALILHERHLIPRAISSVLDQAVGVAEEADLTQLENRLTAEWYKKMNALAQVIGLLATLIVFVVTYSQLTSDHASVWLAEGGRLRLAGWLGVFTITVFWLLLFTYFARGIVHTVILLNITTALRLKVDPFHADDAGGFSGVGRIAIRNQYMLLVAGMNLLLYLGQPRSLSKNSAQ